MYRRLLSAKAFRPPPAKAWAGKYTPEAERQKVAGARTPYLVGASTAPSQTWRAFASAFGCKQGAKMIREKVCEIW